VEKRPHTLICTVGTSLKSNLERHPEGREWLQLFSQGRFRDLARALASLPPENRLLGAEINSTDSIIATGILSDPLYLHLLVSDTPDGQNLGQLLASYYLEKKNPRRFEHVFWQPLAGLTDDNPHRFRTEGLRHLVTAIATISRQRGPEQVVINATGGYKAQISFAGLIGQALNIPVCYLFERFSEVIILPPQPVSLDLSFWLAHAPRFYQLACDRGEPENYEEIDPRFVSLVEEIEVDGQKLVGLTPMGQLFHESFRYRFALQQSHLLPPDSKTKPAGKKITYEASLGPRPLGIEPWFKKLQEKPYVTNINTYYYNPDLPTANYFKPSSKGEVDRVEGGFSDGKATTKFLVFLTANTPAQRDAALSDLWERFLARE
jgi:putative CRISPR-associated protein (TIGR02619 family)